MIEINLLPDSLREVEHTPWPRLVTILIGVILFSALCYFAGKEHFIIMNDLTGQIASIEAFKNSETTKKGVKRVQTLKKNIEGKKQRKEILLGIANAKTMWSKKLDTLNATVNEKFTKNIWFDGVMISPVQKPNYLLSNIPITMKLTTKGHLMLKPEDNVGASIATMQTHIKDTFGNEIDETKFKIGPYTVLKNAEIDKQIVEFPLEIIFLPKVYLSTETPKPTVPKK